MSEGAGIIPQFGSFSTAAPPLSLVCKVGLVTLASDTPFSLLLCPQNWHLTENYKSHILKVKYFHIKTNKILRSKAPINSSAWNRAKYSCSVTANHVQVQNVNYSSLCQTCRVKQLTYLYDIWEDNVSQLQKTTLIKF